MTILDEIKDVATKSAKIVLPRFLEEKFGLTEPEKTMTFPVGEGLSPTETEEAKKVLFRPEVERIKIVRAQQPIPQFLEGIKEGISLGYIPPMISPPETKIEKGALIAGEVTGSLLPFITIAKAVRGVALIPKLGRYVMKYPRLSSSLEVGLTVGAFSFFERKKEEDPMTRGQKFMSGAIFGTGLGAAPFFLAPVIKKVVETPPGRKVVEYGTKYIQKLSKLVDQIKLPGIETAPEWRPPTFDYQNPFTKMTYKYYDRFTNFLSKSNKVPTWLKVKKQPEIIELAKEKNRIIDSLSQKVQDDILRQLKGLTPEQKQQVGLMVTKHIPVTEEYAGLVLNIDKEIGALGRGIVDQYKTWLKEGLIKKEDVLLSEEVFLENLGRYARSFYLRPAAQGQKIVPPIGRTRNLIATSQFKRKLTDIEWGKNSIRYDGKFINDDIEFALSWKDADIPVAKSLGLTIRQIGKISPNELATKMEGIRIDRKIVLLQNKIFQILKGKKPEKIVRIEKPLPSREEFLKRLKKFKYDNVKKFLTDEEVELIESLRNYYALGGEELLSQLGSIYRKELKRIQEFTTISKQKRFSYYQKIIREAAFIDKTGKMVSPTQEELAKTGLKAKKQYGWIFEADAMVGQTFKDTIQNYSNLKWLDAIAKDSTLFSKEATEGFIKVSEILPRGVERDVRLGPLNDGYIHPGFLDEIRFFTTTGRTSGEELFNSLIGMWKLGKVGINPPTVTRNYISGHYFQTDLAGYPVWYPQNFIAYQRAIREYFGKGELYKQARDAGQYGADYFGVEIAPEIRARLNATTDYVEFWDVLSKHVESINQAGKFYGMIDHAARTYLFERATSQGATPGQAVSFANKWELDYRLVPPLIAQVRKQGIAPFISFYWLMTPRILEVLATRPWKLMKYPILAEGLKMYSAKMMNMTEEQLEASKPKWLKKSPYVIPLGFDKNKEPMYFYADYMLPFGNWKTAFVDFEAVQNMVGSLGVYGMPQALVNNYNPLFDKPIWNEADPLPTKVKKAFEYAGLSLGPSGIYHAMNIKKAIEGEVIGYPPFETERSLSQAVSRFFGFPVYSGGRWAYIQKTKDYQRLLQDMQLSIQRIRRDRNLSETKRQEQIERTKSLMRKTRAELKELQKGMNSVEQKPTREKITIPPRY